MPRKPTPLFVDPQDVILRMGLSPDLAGVTEIVSSGIIAAQLHVERIIDGRLARRSQNCLFFTDAESFSGIAPSDLYRLEIPSGLVRTDVPQFVTATTDRNAGAFGSYADVDASLMKFDHPRGYLYLDSLTYGNYHVKVRCDTGYEDGTRPVPPENAEDWSEARTYEVEQQVAYGGVVYRCLQPPPVGTPPPNPSYWAPAYVPQEPLPDDLYEAIMSLVPMVFNAQQTTNRSDEAKNQYQTLTDHANLLLQSYVRTKGFTFRAL